VPGDYWTFPVRAGEVLNPEHPHRQRAPKGIHYHRVPLAVLNWTSGPPVTITALADQIEDCRRVFDPLTDLRGCWHRGEAGEDIHRALKKIFDVVAVACCLLPGDHVLTRPIDLTGPNSVTSRIRSRQPAAVSGQIDPPAPSS